MTRGEAEDFLYREAALLDAWKLDEWLALLTEDARLDIFPVASDSGMLRDVRAVGCRILGEPPVAKPWWKFWGE